MPQDETTGALMHFDDETAEQQIRRVWHDDRWWYSVIDVIALLTGNQRPRKYWFDLRVNSTTDACNRYWRNAGALRFPGWMRRCA